MNSRNAQNYNEHTPINKTDRKLMKQAKERVETRSFLKWMLGLGVVISIGSMVIWFFSEGNEHFWPGYVMAAWVVILITLSIVFIPSLSSRADRKTNMEIAAEYEKLKRRKVYD